MKYFSKNTQAGRSMVEIMGYIVVSMFLIAGISRIISGAYGEYKISQATIQLSDLAGAIVKLSAVDTGYGDTITILKAGGTEARRLIPKSYRVTSSGTYNVFGGKVEFKTTSEVSGLSSEHADDQFAIQYFGLDHEQCVALMTKEWTKNRVVDLYAIVLNGMDYWFWPIYHTGENSHEHVLPVRVSDVAGTGGTDAGLCNASDNSIIWVFN